MGIGAKCIVRLVAFADNIFGFQGGEHRIFFIKQANSLFDPENLLVPQVLQVSGGAIRKQPKVISAFSLSGNGKAIFQTLYLVLVEIFEAGLEDSADHIHDIPAAEDRIRACLVHCAAVVFHERFCVVELIDHASRVSNVFQFSTAAGGIGFSSPSWTGLGGH